MNSPVRICFSYRHIDAPWGGANNFIRALHDRLSARDDFSIVPDIADQADILFMNQLGKGRGFDGSKANYRLAEIKAWKRRNPSGRVIIRAINLKSHARPAKNLHKRIMNYFEDRTAIAALQLADHVIFQSRYQLGFFKKSGYSRKNYTIVHNGAAPEFSSDATRITAADNRLHILSSSMSGHPSKRHDILSSLSQIPNVVVHHAGEWPTRCDAGRVEQLGTVSHNTLVGWMGRVHYFCHPGLYEACSNSIGEALRFGLPVLFNPGPGSSAEIVGAFGIAIDESDLEKTVHLAKERHEGLSADLAKSREEFSIERAADAYAAVFKGMTQN